MLRFLEYSENLLQQNLDFEHVILENALENIVGKFGRHLQIIKPVLERLLEPIEKVEQNDLLAGTCEYHGFVTCLLCLEYKT